MERNRPSNNVRSRERGIEAERLAALYFQERGDRLYANRLRTPYGEADLIFELAGGGGYALLEVKSLGPRSDEWLMTRVSPRQKVRLAQIRQYLEERFRTPVGLHLVLVSHKGEVRVLYDFLC